MNAVFNLNGIVIETNRLLLRPFAQEDLQDFFQYASVEGVGEMAGWCHHKSIEESQRILNNFIVEDKTFALVFKENNKVVGSLGVEFYGREDALTEFFPYVGRELGFVLAKDYWGKGLMAEAVCAVADYLFNKQNFDFLLCGYYEYNHQSKRVQQKCGFRPYRRLDSETKLGTVEPTILNLLVNPNKIVTLSFSHPETLIYNKN